MSAPHPQPPGEPPRILRRSPTTAQEPEAKTHIIRRAPLGGVPEIPDDVRTGLIAPMPSDAPTGLVSPLPPAPPEEPTGLIPRPAVDFTASPADPAGAAAATAVSIVNGWATAVIATDLVTSWWRTDTVFCVAVAFLATVLAVTTVAGVILLMLHRRLGSWLIVAGSLASLLMFASLFVAGAAVPWIVYAVPVLPVVGAVLALLPATRRWWRRS